MASSFQERWWASRVSFDTGGIECSCPGYMPGLGLPPCNRPADPLTGYCAGCSRSECWCSCADCDPSSPSSSEESNGSSETERAPLPLVIAEQYENVLFVGNRSRCMCNVWGMQCAEPAVRDSRFCESCMSDECLCFCDQCNPRWGPVQDAWFGADSRHIHEPPASTIVEPFGRRAGSETNEEGHSTVVVGSGGGGLGEGMISGPGGGGSGEGIASGGHTSLTSGSTGGIMLCRPCLGPQDIVPLQCICDHGHGDQIFACVRRPAQGSLFCEDCSAEICTCVCIHCDPDLVVAPAEDYDIDGHEYFNPATHNRVNIDPPRCFCVRGGRPCEFVATHEGFCERCYARRCMCPCRGCDPDDFNFDEHGQALG